MKFVHIADLHLGKVLHQSSLLEIQRELLFEILEYMNDKDIRLLLIAGDIYDRFIPSQEAVNLLDEFLGKALLDYGIDVFMISGNHDSSDRLHFGSSILSSRGLHIETYLHKEIKYIEKEDVRFYLLPFVKPSQVKLLFDEGDIHNYNDALNVYIKNQVFDSKYKNILMTHQFVGGTSITSESEVPLSVGGSEIVDVSVFKDFDYVALGHLHAPQKVSRDTIRYSGSLMRYSFDETKQDKSIVVVDTEDMSIDYYRLHPSQTLCTYTGSFHQFMDPSFIECKKDFISFELSDETLIPHAVDQLRVLYPHLLQITYSYLMKQQGHLSHQSIQTIEKMDTQSLFSSFYLEMKNQDLTDEQHSIVSYLLEKVGDHHESH